MKKETKKTIIILALVLVALSGTITYGVIRLKHHWKTDPEAICNIAGGFWDGVQGCDNFCDKTGKDCPDKIIFGCWCGLDKCWTGTECILKK